MKNRVPLSAVDLLGLSSQRKVARVDLSDAGYEGILFVCDLTAAQQQQIMSGPRRGKTRVYRDGAMDIDWADMPQDASARFLMACLVTDREGGRQLQAAFENAPETDAEFFTISFPADDLVLMADELAKELKTKTAAREKLEQLPNAVTSLLMRVVRQISGLVDDQVEEKNASS